MALKVEGINRILKKLNNLENIDIKQGVEQVAENMQNKLRESARAFSTTEYKCIAKCETRAYKGANVFVDIGLKNDNAPWGDWKGLYFQNFGYAQHIFGHNLGYINTKHILWFENVVNAAAKEIQKELKKKLKDEVNKALR